MTMKKYQVLARKYRPQTFQDVLGQDAIVTTLKNALRFDKLAYGYLFSGPRGTGKTTLARLFAKAMNCTSLNKDLEPCNQCSSCIEITEGSSLDVIEIDGASNRGIDDVRQINEMVGYVPTHGKYKIYIIDEVHMLTKEAFNALLKTLEEPPERAKFFFATTEPHKVLPTIISRCQRFDLKRLLPSSITQKLSQIGTDLNRTIEEEALLLIAELSDGALRDAESLLDQLLCFTEGPITGASVRQMFGLASHELFVHLDAAFEEANLAYAFTLVSDLYAKGKDLPHFITELVSHYRNLALYKTAGPNALQESLKEKYEAAAKNYTKEQAVYILEYLIQAESSIQKSLSPRIFLENALLHIIRSKQKIPVEKIARRLLELKNSLQEKKAPQTETNIPEEKETIETSPPPKKISPKIGETTLPEIKPSETSSPSKTILPKALEALPSEKKEPEAKDKQINQKTPRKSQSHYDTLMRFAAVELEGSIKL